MARTNVPVTLLPQNAGTAPAPVTLDNTNGHNILAVPGKSRRLLIKAINTGGAPLNITVRQGVSPPALRANIGDLVIAVPATSEVLIPTESGRFYQVDGSINVDTSLATGTIAAVLMP